MSSALVARGLLTRHFVGTNETANGNGLRGESLLQSGLEIPLGTRHAAEKIETERAVFGKCVAREMRFGEQTEAGDSAGVRELVPLRLAYRAQFHTGDDF